MKLSILTRILVWIDCFILLFHIFTAPEYVLYGRGPQGGVLLTSRSSIPVVSSQHPNQTDTQKMESSAESPSSNAGSPKETGEASTQEAQPRWWRKFGAKSKAKGHATEEPTYRSKSTLGILSDRETDEVPGMLWSPGFVTF